MHIIKTIVYGSQDNIKIHYFLIPFSQFFEIHSNIRRCIYNCILMRLFHNSRTDFKLTAKQRFSVHSNTNSFCSWKLKLIPPAWDIYIYERKVLIWIAFNILLVPSVINMLKKISDILCFCEPWYNPF